MSHEGKDVQQQATDTQPAFSLPDKRPYHAPTLRWRGNVRQHTLANATPGIPAPDGGAPPNVYAS